MQNKQIEVNVNNIKRLFKVLLQSIDDMVSFLKKENSLLLKGAVSDASKILDQKCKILGDFQDVELHIRSYMKEHSSDIDPQIQKLITTAKNKYAVLRELIKKNELLLESNVRIGKKMIELYNSVKLDEIMKLSPYNKSGEITFKKDAEKFMPAINLNSRV